MLTGHACGLITLNVEEADDSIREKVRHEMREPYRTLLGHLRHEIGHYYWDRLIADTEWLEKFRELFGDEREDYAAACRKNYEQGPPPDWRDRISVPTRRSIPGKTGRRLGRTTSTWSTVSTRRCPLVCAERMSKRPSSRSP